MTNLDNKIRGMTHISIECQGQLKKTRYQLPVGTMYANYTAMINKAI